MTDEKRKIDLTGMDTVKGSNEGFDVRLYHPGTKQDIGIVIRVLGKDSDRFNQISAKQRKRMQDKMSKGGFRNIGKTLSPEEQEQNELELLAECTVGWFELITEDEEEKTVPCDLTFDGADYPFSVPNAKFIYKAFPAFREQVDEAIGDRSNFTVR